jgi:hypothetical protein
MHVIQAHHLKKSKEFRSWQPLQGYQMRYVYFLNPAARERLTVPILPFSKIEEMGASMYRGQARGKDQESANPVDLGGETPTPTLQITS